MGFPTLPQLSTAAELFWSCIMIHSRIPSLRAAAILALPSQSFSKDQDIIDPFRTKGIQMNAPFGGALDSTSPADPSRSRTADGTGFCADHRTSGSVPVRQADRELSGTGAAGGLERESATAGPYHQTRQLSVALLAGGSGPGDGAQRSRMAEQVPPSDDATGPEDRQDRDGPQTRRFGCTG